MTHDVFGLIRSLASFRLTGDSRDYIVVGSDSGKIIVLEYKPDRKAFNRVHSETFGKTGVRRIMPGEFLACDPQGRAVMIGAGLLFSVSFFNNKNALQRPSRSKSSCT